jgi:hypothetical protein
MEGARASLRCVGGEGLAGVLREEGVLLPTFMFTEFTICYVV